MLQCKEKGAFTVVVDGYVKEEEGTGVVHQAPYFGAVSVNYTSVMLILASTRSLAFPAPGVSVRVIVCHQSSQLLLRM